MLLGCVWFVVGVIRLVCAALAFWYVRAVWWSDICDGQLDGDDDFVHALR